MKIALAYVCVTGAPWAAELAARFVATYTLFPPGVEHQTIILCNGGPLNTERTLLFCPLPQLIFHPRGNDEGWDISAYQEIAGCTDADMLVCLGESVYFHRPGWLTRMVEAWQRHGPGMYGFMATHNVRAHFNTSAFVTSPELLKSYPWPVTNRAERYRFEHGDQSYWRTLRAHGKPTLLVTWDGEWQPTQWRMPNNILWRGDQSNVMVWCNHVDRWNNANTQTRNLWSRNADQPFR
jgi:hypothetical protein